MRHPSRRMNRDLQDLAPVLAGLLEGAALFDSEGRLLWSNPAFQRLAKMEAPDTGTRLAEFWDQSGPWLEVLEGRQPAASFEAAFVGRSGVQSPVSARFFSVRTGFVLEVLGPEVHGSEKFPGESQKLAVLGQLTGGIAHDLNNMLGILMGMADLIKSSLPPTDPLQESVDLMLQTLSRASSLSEKMLNFARRSPPARHPLDLAVLLAELRFLTRTALPLGVEAEFEVGTGPWWIEGDENSLLSALLNLVINAGEALPQGGVVKVAARELEGSLVEVTVRDNGTGIDPETLARVFEPFYSTKLQQKGTGLGLSLAKKTVQDHGGSISLESAPGQGTTARVILPLRP